MVAGLRPKELKGTTVHLPNRQLQGKNTQNTESLYRDMPYTCFTLGKKVLTMRHRCNFSNFMMLLLLINLTEVPVATVALPGEFFHKLSLEVKELKK